jgi:lipopolysaccharide export system protein LptA
MSALPRLTSARLFRALAGLAAVGLALVVAAPSSAQTLSNTFGGLSQSSKDPIDIESDMLVVHDQQKYATFSGNVKAVQGTTTLRAQELKVHYVGGPEKLNAGKNEGADQAAPATKVADVKPAGGLASDDGTQITEIDAKGDVIINSDKDQTTTSEWAIYDVPSQMVTVGGNVVLTQGKNVLKGDRLVIDLKTGESRFENTGNATAGGRIRALFMPKEGADAKSGDVKPDDAKSGDAKSAAAPEAAPADEVSGTAEPAADEQGNAASATDGAAEGSKPAKKDDSPWSLVPGLQP